MFHHPAWAVGSYSSSPPGEGNSPNLSQHNPGLRPDETTCILLLHLNEYTLFLSTWPSTLSEPKGSNFGSRLCYGYDCYDHLRFPTCELTLGIKRRARLAAPLSAVTKPMKAPKFPSLSASNPAAGGPSMSARGTAVLTRAVSSMLKPKDLQRQWRDQS